VSLSSLVGEPDGFVAWVMLPPPVSPLVVTGPSLTDADSETCDALRGLVLPLPVSALPPTSADEQARSDASETRIRRMTS